MESVREIDVSVKHCLLAHAGVPAERLRFIASHPAALAQCTRLFVELADAAQCAASDTAGAACELAEYARAPVDATMPSFFTLCSRRTR